MLTGGRRTNRNIIRINNSNVNISRIEMSDNVFFKKRSVEDNVKIIWALGVTIAFTLLSITGYLLLTNT